MNAAQPQLAGAPKERKKAVAPLPVAPGRLKTLVEQRQTGWQRNILAGRLEPLIKSFHIGHGQQIDRTRLKALQAANATVYGTLPEPALGRQSVRRLGRKDRKAAEAGARREGIRTRRLKKKAA